MAQVGLNQDEWSVVWEFVNFHHRTHNLSYSLINKSWHTKSCSDEYWKFKYLNGDDDDDDSITNATTDYNMDGNMMNNQENFKRKLIRERRSVFLTLSDHHFDIVDIFLQVGTVLAVFACSLMFFLFVFNNIGELLTNSMRRSGFEEVGYRNRFHVANGIDSCLVRNIEPFWNRSCYVMNSRWKDVFQIRLEWNGVNYFIVVSFIVSVLSFLLAIGISHLRKVMDMNLMIEKGKIIEKIGKKKIRYRSDDTLIMLALFITCRHDLVRDLN